MNLLVMAEAGLGTFQAGSSASRIKKYTGEWAFDKKNGKGEIWFTNGNQYEGTFKKDLVRPPPPLQIAFAFAFAFRFSLKS